MGRSALVANAANSLAMQPFARVVSVAGLSADLPGVPNSDGAATVKPLSTR